MLLVVIMLKLVGAEYNKNADNAVVSIAEYDNNDMDVEDRSGYDRFAMMLAPAKLALVLGLIGDQRSSHSSIPSTPDPTSKS